MKTNLINNYINIDRSKKTEFSGASKTPSSNENFGTLSNRTYIQPLQGRGYLVRSNAFDAPATMARSFAYDMKSLKSGLKGDSNDHQLGKINDLGMKIGGLTVAAYLFTKKQTPLTKAMEFVGFGSFFASMALWPKVALQAPARLIHGFNTQQRYVDANGREKPFYQDHQFIPWDLYSDKEINKIGNRLNVPKDIPNRREFIQEKMKKIALQNNTMWMLTAGFATPVMSALMCNLAEKGILKWQNNNKDAKANKMLTSIGEVATSICDKKLDEAKIKEEISKLDKYLKEYNFESYEKAFNAIKEDQPFTKELITEIANSISPNMNNLTKKELEKDLTGLYLTSDRLINKDVAKSIVSKIHAEIDSKIDLSEYCDEETLLPISKEQSQDLKDNMKKAVSEETIMEHFKKEGALNGAQSSVKLQEMNNHLANSAFKDAADSLKVDKNLVDQLRNISLKSISEAFDESPASIFNKEAKTKIKEVADVLHTHAKFSAASDEYALIKVANAPETVLANKWNEVSANLIKILDITPKEMKTTKDDRVLVQELIRSKIEKIASLDEKAYTAKIKELVKQMASFDDQIRPADIDFFCGVSDKVHNYTAGRLTDFGKTSVRVAYKRNNQPEKWDDVPHFQNTINSLIAPNANGKGSLNRLQQKFVTERIAGVKNTFYRLINTFDVYRRISTGNFPEEWLKDEKDIKKLTTQVQEELIEAIKQMTLQGHSSDHSIKGYFLRNSTPSSIECKVEIKDGKVVPNVEVLKNNKNIKRVDMPWDHKFYKKMMEYMYKCPMDGSTIKAFEQHKILLGNLAVYNNEFIHKIGSAEYFSKLEHKAFGHDDNLEKFLIDQKVEGAQKMLEDLKKRLTLDEKCRYKATAEEKFLLCGSAPDEFFTKAINKAYNTKKWLKMFGGFAIGLTAVTVGSQFFFGRMKNPKKVQEG